VTTYSDIRSLIDSGSYAYTPGSGVTLKQSFTSTTSVAPIGAPTITPPAIQPNPTVSPAAESTITGFDPAELAAVSYGKALPIFIGGLARIGGIITVGPFIDGTTASWGTTFGFAVNPAGTREFREISFDSKAVWNSVDGYLGDTFTKEEKLGTHTQTVSNLETVHFGASAVAYRPQIMLFFEDIDLTPWGGKIPYVAALIGDTTDGADPTEGLTLGDALERIAYSPWVGMSADTFETVGIEDVIQAAIIAEDKSFLELLREFNQVYRSWDIVQTDKLRVIDRGSDVTPNIVLTGSNILGPVSFSKQAPASIPRETELVTVDPGADYMMLPSTARRPYEPVAVSGATGKQTMSLPIVIDATTRQSLVTYSKFASERARTRVGLNVSGYASQIEPGDIVELDDLYTGIPDDVYKVIESSHNGDYTVGLVMEAMLRCQIGAAADPDFANVIVLIGGNGEDASTIILDEGNEHKTITVTGNAQIDTAVKKFGSGAVYFDGTGDWLGFPFGDADFNLPPMWTHEAWVNFASTSGQPSIFGVWNTPFSGYQLRYTAGSLDWFCFNGTNFSGSFSPDTETWYHIAIDRDGTTTRLYVNGVMIASTTGAQSGTADIEFTVGAAASLFNGWIDEYRFTSGVARYASDSGYTTPTSAFPRY
jgi:hypothetical protein